MLANLSFGVRRAVARVPAVRTMATVPTIDVDWAAVRGSMITEKARSNIDRVREQFTNRLNKALAVGEPGDIDWAFYQEKLPYLDIDALKANYQQFQSAIPAISYDASADAAAHAEQEAAWKEFTQYCIERVAELEKLKVESKEHALHDQYSLNRAFQRFDGLFEAEWAKMQNMDFESTLDAPDTTEQLPEAQKVEMRREISKATGLPMSFFNSEDK